MHSLDLACVTILVMVNKQLNLVCLATIFFFKKNIFQQMALFFIQINFKEFI